MFNLIISLDNLFSAWRGFRCGKRDKPDVQFFERHLEDNIFQLHQELKNNQYHHSPYERFHIFDPKHRIIHKAQARDRIIHHAIYRIISPIFEQSFIYDSYSCRINKGTHKAVNRLRDFTRKVSKNYTKPCWALKCDIKKFFNSIDHEILINLLKRRIPDADAIRLNREIIKSFPAGGG